MKKILLLNCCVLFTAFLFAQKKRLTTELVTIADLELKSCPFEPEANAMKLLDIQETEFDMLSYRFQRATRKVRIKIFNEKGFKQANISIPYFSKRGMAKIKDLTGAIYNLGEDGGINVQRLDKDDFFKEKAADYVGTVSFTFPGLKAGSIVEYSYTTVENNLVYFLPWIIQDDIPVAFTSKIFNAPAETKIFERAYGVDSIQKERVLLKNDRYQRVTYSRENIPSFKTEPFMSSVADHMIRVSFHVLPWGGTYQGTRGSSDAVWSSAGRSLLWSSLYRDQVQKLIPGTEKIIDSAKAMPIKEDRVRYIYNRVKNNIPEKVEQTTSADDLKSAWENKNGTSAEINLILLNLLEQSGVQCVPLLVSTRSHGKVNKDFPSLGQLNGIDVLAIDSTKFYLLDASLKYQSYQNPPLNILNREAYMLSTDSMQWVMVTDDRPLLKMSTIILSDLTTEGKIEGSGTVQYYDYAKAYKLDTTLNAEKAKDDDDKFIDKRELDVKILSVKKENTETPDEPLTETIEFIYEPQKNDDFIFINPQVLNDKIKNPFLAEKRNTDIDLGCNQLQMLNFQLHFPPEFAVEHLPKSVKVRAPDSSFLFVITYSSDAENLYITQHFESKRAIFYKEEYPGLQDFFKRMYALMSEEIILKKKK